MKWISAREDKPANLELVLVYDSLQRFNDRFQLMTWDAMQEVWITEGGISLRLPTHRITHWCRLQHPR